MSFTRKNFGYDCRNSWLVLKSTLLLSIVLLVLPLAAREKDATQYGAGLIVNIPLPEAEVSQIVQEVAQNGIIRGTKEYNKDEYVSGATALSSTKAFAEFAEGGKVFYKVRLKALNPQNFKDGNDVGTLAVRYVVQSQDDRHTVLRIDARFVEDYRRVSHSSNGSVEGAEYKAIRDKLDAIEAIKIQTTEFTREKDAQRSVTLTNGISTSASTSSTFVPTPDSANHDPANADSTNAGPAPVGANSAAETPSGTPPQTLEERVQELRRQVERVVKAPGAALKSAPFHTASTLQSLPAGEQVLIEIASPYWVGVETHSGQHGWIQRDELELLP